jgi:hypothetical protein
VGHAEFSAGCKEQSVIHSVDLGEWCSRGVIDPKVGALEAVYL